MAAVPRPHPAVEAPAGFTFLAGDHYPPGATLDTRIAAFENGPTRDWFNPIYLKAHARGGHFVPWENPEAVIDDVRAAIRELRFRAAETADRSIPAG